MSPFTSPPLMAISRQDLSWLAGLLEGEGSFMARRHNRRRLFCISVGMKDQDVISRAAKLMGGVKPQYNEYRQGDKLNYLWRATLYGERAKRLSRLLYPHMGWRRRYQIVTAWLTVLDEETERNKRGYK